MTEKEIKTSVLFVCMGNICRSPTAEGVFRHHVTESGLAEQIFIDSAGTHAYHVGEPPDRRSQAAAERRGFRLDKIRARRVSDEDFERFDLVLAMDKLNHVTLIERAGDEHHGKIRLFLEYSKSAERPTCPIPTTVARPASNASSTWSRTLPADCWTSFRSKYSL